MYDFDLRIDRRNTDCLKWDGIEKGDLLPMWVADMDFKCPPQVTQALARRVEQGVFGYAYPGDSYYDSIINWMKKRHHWEVKREWISTSPGVVPALDMLVRALAQPGERVIIQSPVYHPFFNVVRNNGCLVENNPLYLDGGRYRMDLEDLSRKAAAGARLLILCSPHNPVGRVWSADELLELAEICLRHGITVISDEIHCDLIFPGHHHTVFAALSPEIEQNCIICNAPSKTFNIPGIQASSVIIPNPDLRARLRAVTGNNGLGLPSVFAVTALEAAYNHGEPWLEELIIYLQGNLEYLTRIIGEKMPRIKVIRPEATYLVWIDFRELGLTDPELQRVLAREGLVLSPGHIFGPGGSGFQRINIACPRATLQEGLERLERAVRSV